MTGSQLHLNYLSETFETFPSLVIVVNCKYKNAEITFFKADTKMLSVILNIQMSHNMEAFLISATQLA